MAPIVPRTLAATGTFIPDARKPQGLLQRLFSNKVDCSGGSGNTVGGGGGKNACILRRADFSASKQRGPLASTSTTTTHIQTEAASLYTSVSSLFIVGTYTSKISSPCLSQRPHLPSQNQGNRLNFFPPQYSQHHHSAPPFLCRAQTPHQEPFAHRLRRRELASDHHVAGDGRDLLLPRCRSLALVA